VNTTVKRIPTDQHESVCGLMDWYIEVQSTPAIPKDQTPAGLRSYNLLLRRGFVVRFEFEDRRFGYSITRKGQDYCLATEPEEYSVEEVSK
jgi:hypothetical protein